MDNPFLHFLSQLAGGNRKEYEPIAFLSKNENEEWEKISKDYDKVKSLIYEIDARRKLFWISIEHKLDIYDKSLKIEDGIVFMEKEDKHNCDHQSNKLNILGFCDGNCDDCAFNTDEDSNIDTES